MKKGMSIPSIPVLGRMAVVLSTRAIIPSITRSARFHKTRTSTEFTRFTRWTIAHSLIPSSVRIGSRRTQLRYGCIQRAIFTRRTYVTCYSICRCLWFSTRYAEVAGITRTGNNRKSIIIAVWSWMKEKKNLGWVKTISLFIVIYACDLRVAYNRFLCLRTGGPLNSTTRPFSQQDSFYTFCYRSFSPAVEDSVV